jgi:hypothetical protein
MAYTLFSTKLEIRAKQFLPGSEGVGGRGRGWGKGSWQGEGGKNDPNIVCTYEYKIYFKKITKNDISVLFDLLDKS